MRILLWRTVLLPGSETFIRAQADELAALGHDVRLVGAEGVVSPLRRPDDLVLFGGGSREERRRRLFLRTGASLRLDRLLRRWKPDVAHVHFLTSAGLLAPALRLHGVPLVVTAHGFDATSRGASRSPLPLRRYPRPRIAKVIAVSDFIRSRVLDLGVDPAEVEVLHTGIPLGTDEPRVPLARREQALLFVGRLVEKKGVADLLDALDLLPEPQRSTPLRIVGEGPLRQELERSARSRGLDVAFLGALDPAGVEREMDASTIFCAPSRTARSGDAEGLGHVFLEASSRGLPIVAYRHGGVPEAVLPDRTGLLVQEGDVGAVSRALSELLTDPLRAAALGRAGRDFVTERFDVRAQTERLADAYRAVLRE